MRNKIILIIAALAISLSSYAQFETGKKYVGASLSGLDLNYSGSKEFTFGLQAKGGYFFLDNCMATAQLSYDKSGDDPSLFSIGLGARYYLVQNGIYFGASATYFYSDDYAECLPSVQVGYSFFINGSVTIEPEIYYNQSFMNHGDYSTFGLRIGLGIYL